MKSRLGYLSILIVSIVLGVMLAVQFKVTQGNPADFNVRRTQDVIAELKQIKEERDNLKSEVEELTLNLQKAIAGKDKGNETLIAELAKARQVAGLVSLKGTGIVVTLNDSARILQPGEDPNLYLIHDEDILKVVNELNAAGAEAISVNNQRILATSEIRCAGPTIQINGNRISPPFVIAAIGDPASLESSLRLRGGIIENLEFWGIQVSIDKPKEVLVPGYMGSIKYKYASPVEEG